MKIYRIGEIPSDIYSDVGGKARGLDLLKRGGYTVPEGIVLTDAATGGDFAAVCSEVRRVCGDGSVAVRSSASAEDGIMFSSAGQYATFLNVRGDADISEAINSCLKSLHSETAESYSAYFSAAKSEKMNIIIQQMIQPDYAGVAFSRCPGDSEKILVESVRGLGENLVSGADTAMQFRFDRDSLECADLIPEDMDKMIISEAAAGVKRAEEIIKTPADCEWAVRGGSLYWLQLRPITTDDDGVSMHEFDGDPLYENAVITSCNVGEMLPGAVTPLTLTTSVEAIDRGMRKMLVRAGAYVNLRKIPAGTCVISVCNNLFLNLTPLFKLGYSVMGANVEGVSLSLCGRVLENLPQMPFHKKFSFIRIKNAVNYFRMLFSSSKARKKLVRLIRRLRINETESPERLYKEINRKLRYLNLGLWYHYITSAHAGAMSSALIVILQKTYSAEDCTNILSGLLADIDDIESVDILRSMTKIAKSILKDNPGAACMSVQEIEQAIRACRVGSETWSAYICFKNRHGHRAVREAEMRSKSWNDDMAGLCKQLKMIIESGAEEPKKDIGLYQRTLDALLSEPDTRAKKAIKFLTQQSRIGVVNRESSKSNSMKVVEIFKEAYRRLAKLLCEQGYLPDEDLIFFLTHKEIRSLIFDRDLTLIKKAIKRRRLLPQQMQCRFDEVCIGMPKEHTAEETSEDYQDTFTGTILSKGTAVGTARVVKSIDDANQLREGEIMVAGFTDIGWSPYYSVIAGLVTEVGSSLSHGAVVAREFGLPLISNIKGATSLIHTGDTIKIDSVAQKVYML